MKHALVLLLACLLISALAPYGTAAPADVFHVGGSGSGTYTSIDGAMTAAAPGDHVVVHPGSYPGIAIDKPLTVEGRHAALPSIDITADNVTVTGFIVNGGSHGITITGRHATVSSCSVLNHTYGVTVKAAHASITGNHVYRNTYYGIWLQYGESCRIDGNDIYRNHEGVYVSHADGSIVANNTLANNTHGVHLEGTAHAVVHGNMIADSQERGVYFCCGSRDNTIHGNTFIGNQVNAWGYDGANTWDNRGTGNYWDDYNGTGAYVIDTDNVDRHPLQQPVTVPSLPDTIYILSPAAGQTVNGTVVIRGVSEQARPVDIRVDNGSWSRAQGNVVWHMALDITGLADGSHTIQVRCGSAAASRSFFVDRHGETGAMPALALTGIMAAVSIAFFYRRRHGSR